jgi:predicted TPR repeat methyltransferase
MGQDGKRNFDLAAAGWDDEPRRVALARDVAEAMLLRLSLDGRQEALDLGCGTGLVTLHLAPHLKAITGLDGSAGMLARLAEKLRALSHPNVFTRLQELEDDRPLGGPYDLVVSSMTLHHVRDVPGLLGRVHAALRPGGWVAVADLDPDAGNFHQDPSGVAHHGFERRALASQLEQVGFTEVRVETATTTERERDGQRREFTVFLATGRRPEEMPGAPKN